MAALRKKETAAGSSPEPPVNFKVNGKVFNDPFLLLARARAIIAKLPDDELLTTTELFLRAGFGRHSSLSTWLAGKLMGNWVRMGRNYYWGNPRALAELQRQLKESQS